MRPKDDERPRRCAQSRPSEWPYAAIASSQLPGSTEDTSIQARSPTPGPAETSSQPSSTTSPSGLVRADGSDLRARPVAARSGQGVSPPGQRRLLQIEAMASAGAPGPPTAGAFRTRRGRRPLGRLPAATPRGPRAPVPCPGGFLGLAAVRHPVAKHRRDLPVEPKLAAEHVQHVGNRARLRPGPAFHEAMHRG